MAMKEDNMQSFIYNLVIVSIDTSISIIKMLTKTQEHILVFLFNNHEGKFTIRGIAKRLNKSYTLIYNNIADLCKKKIIEKESVPPAQIIMLSEFAPIEVFIDIEFKKKRSLLMDCPWIKIMLKDMLMAAKNYFFILLVFGSYAKGNQTQKSDIDLLVIVQDKKDIKKIEDKFYGVYSKVKKGLNFVDISGFRDMVKNTNEFNIGNEAKRNHIILHGIEEYYQIIKT